MQQTLEKIFQKKEVVFAVKILKKPTVQGLILALVLSSFLLQKGVWIYQDNIFLAKNVNEAWQELRRLFSSLEIADYYSTYWGYDSLYFNVGRITIFPIYLVGVVLFRDAGVSQYLFFVLFYFVSYIVLYSFFGIFSKNAFGKTLAAFFVITTQFFLHSYSLLGFAYSIIAIPVFVISLVRLLESKIRWFYVATLILSMYWIMAYQRYFVMYVVLATIALVIGSKHILKMWKRILYIVPIIIVCTLPVLLAFYGTHQDIRFGTSFNTYQIYYKYTNGVNSYNINLHTSPLKAFDFLGSGSTFLSLHNPTLETVSLVLACALGILVIWYILRRFKLNVVTVSITLLYTSAIFLFALAHFVSQQAFIHLTYDVLSFLSNDANYVKIVSLLVTGIFIPFIYQALKFWWKVLFVSIILVYAGISISPIFVPTEKKAQLTFDNVPQEYQNEFFSKTGFEPYLYYPNSISRADLRDPYGAYYSWYQTPISFNQNLKYRMLMSSNVRLVNLKQARLFNEIITKPGAVNSKYFNLKNILIYKDVRNPLANQFDYYNAGSNYTSEGMAAYNTLKTGGNFTVLSENARIAHFAPSTYSVADYFLYSPNEIITRDLSTLFDKGQEIRLSKPVILDSTIKNKPNSIKQKSNIVAQNQNIHVDAKISLNDRGIIYAKISNINEAAPFLLQLNQANHPQWRIAVISKDEYDKVSCGPVENFKNTQNSTCDYKGSTLDLKALQLIRDPQISGQRFAGNFIGNTWLLNPENYAQYSKDGELYVAIYYRRQVWYHYAAVISGTSLLALLMTAGFQEIYMLHTKRRWDSQVSKQVQETLESKLISRGKKKG